MTMNDYDWNNEKDNIDTDETPSQETQKLQPEQEGKAILAAILKMSLARPC